ncbi:MAG: hypothetical protein AABW59_01005 [archaeon]
MNSSPAQNLPMDYNHSKEAYSMDFDLFKLGKFESINQSAYLKGKNCRAIFNELVADVCKAKSCSKWSLSKELSIFYNSERSTMPKFLSGKDYFPVYLVSKLIEFLNEESKQKYVRLFNESVQYFKVGTSHGWLKFPREMSAELAWLCGAVAADGWITREKSGGERIGIVDFHRKALIKASNYFEKCFGFKPAVKKHGTKNCWQIVFRSKPIILFFTTYLGFHHGVKVYDTCEPLVVKESDFRLDFASGVLSFDGSVALDGVVSLGVVSENLAKDIFEILIEAKLKVVLKKEVKKKQTVFFVKSEGLLQHKDSKKWISVFGADIEKGQRLDALVNGFIEVPASEEDALLRLKKFINYPRRKECPVYDLFYVLKKGGSIKRQQLLNETKLPHVTFYKYVWLLRKANIVSCHTGYFGRGIENTYTFNYNIKEWRVPSVY